jgi:amino acid adenylation domain-containing protein/thioester reductase-like protein
MGTFVHERFAQRATERPTAIAVEQNGGRLSYAELDRRADELARRLRAHAIGRGSVVMTHLERSPDLIVSMLATLKAGAAYLPVDPEVPAHRTLPLLDEAACAAVITDPGNRSRFDGRDVVLLDPDVDREPAPQSRSAPSGPSGPSDLSDLSGPSDPAPTALDDSDPAYVIYTSGSSGTPKGVKVGHGSLAHLCAEINARYGIGPEDRVLQFAAVTFDTSIEQILLTLLNGATLVLPEGVWAPSEMASELVKNQVTVMDLTPSYWRAFLAELISLPAELPVRLTIVGGDTVQAGECRTALRLMPDARLVNAYGLTETTITTCTMDITGPTLPTHGPVLVGRPLPGTAVHVLDEELRPVPPGETGEIYISGHGVALGYLTENADHTRFQPDHLAGTPGTRMYRTGDLGCRTPDGDLRIMGRADRQVKVRGFRVEPAEIEAVLAAHRQIANVAVTTYSYRGEREIAAHYVPVEAGAEAPTPRDLHAHLSGRLPHYMVPTSFVRLAEMPLKSNGKTDLEALPKPSLAARTAAASDHPHTGTAAGPLERGMHAIWREVLEVDRIGPDDAFFELGGDSIAAAQLLARVRASFGITITQVRPLIRRLLDGATLRGFAEAIEAARAGTFSGDASAVDFAAEARLDVEIRRTPERPASWADPAHILLTGVTGFLGIYLLRELLNTTGATVHCLVRAEDAAQAMHRIQANARHYFGEDLDGHRHSGRIQAVPGDLAEPGLGLAAEEFDRLAGLVDVIHHPGGLVNFIYPYDHMRAANVEGTREIIRLAARYRNAPVHYTSTMAVISGFGTAGVRHVTEETPADHVDHLSVGYVESKWVAEAVLREAADQGLPVAIYRAADISGDRDRGAWNTATEMCAMKKFIVDTGMSPLAELPLDYTPVDCFAAAVAHIAARKLPAGEVYHLTNPGKVNVAVLTERLRAHGHIIREVPWDDWLGQVVKTAVEDPDHPMTPFAPLFIDRCSTGEMSVAEMYLETTFPVFTRDNVEAALRDSGIDIPPVDAELLDRYIRYLTSIDFL